MSGLLYKTDSLGDRLSNNIKATFEFTNGKKYIKSNSFKNINLRVNDYLYYSDDDLEINKPSKVVASICDDMLEIKEAKENEE